MNKTTVALILAFALIPASNVLANDPGGACRDDVKRLCGEVHPGGGAIKDCLKTHEAELSQGCKEKMAEGKKRFEEKMKEVEAACAADLKQYCADVTPGDGRQMACLKAHEDKISAPCKEKFAERKMHRKHKK